jgi:hypothetical protein
MFVAETNSTEWKPEGGIQVDSEAAESGYAFRKESLAARLVDRRLARVQYGDAKSPA